MATSLPAAGFQWEPTRLYYLAGWLPGSGWTPVGWYLGHELSEAVRSYSYLWFAIYSHARQRWSLYDSREPTLTAAVYGMALSAELAA